MAIAVARARAQAPNAAGAAPTGAAAPASTASAGEDAESSAASAEVTATEMDALPKDGQDWRALQVLSPAASDPDDAEDGGVRASFRGLEPAENLSLIDGLSDEQSFQSGPRGLAGSGRAEYTFSSEAVRGLRISAHSYSAEVGNGVGGVVRAVTRSGGNTLHGSAQYLLRSSALAAVDPYAIETHYTNGVVSSALVKPHDLRQQGAGSIGGALRRDRLFYFYVFDGMHRGYPAMSSPQYAQFYTLTAMQQTLLANRGVTAAQINTALNYIDSLTGTVARSAGQTVNFGKLDWQRTAAERWSLAYNRARWSSAAGSSTSPVVARGRASLGNSRRSVDTGVARWSRTLTAHLSEELSAQYSRELATETAQTPLPQEPAISPGGFAPQVTIGDVGDLMGLVYGTPAAAGRQAYPDERRTQVVEAATWVRGRLQVQVGGSWSKVQDRIAALRNAEGSFVYDSSLINGHAGGLVDWITDYSYGVSSYPQGGCPTIHPANNGPHDFCFRTFTQSFGQQQVEFNVQEWAAYAQSVWHARKGLTINAGVRWEYELLPLPQQPNAALDTVFLAQGGTSIFPEDRNNFGPRAGLAWSPGWLRGLVVHAGYGLFFGRLAGSAVRSALLNTALPQTTLHVRITPTTITQCPQAATGQGFGYPCAYTSLPPQAVAQTTSATVFGRRFRLPAMQQGELGVEHGLPGGITASATYMLDMAVQLPNAVDLNIAPTTATQQYILQGGDGRGAIDGETFVVPVYTQRTDTDYGPVTAMVSNANASYNAMLLEAERRAGRLTLRGSWVWSKTIDYGETGGGAVRESNQFDPFNQRYDRGLSLFNMPHKLVVSAVWEPRVAWGGMGLLSARVLNGWQLSGIGLESAGRPYSYRIFGGTRLSGGRETINGSGGANYLPTVGRNTLRLPDTATVDLRLARRFGLGRRAGVRVFAQGFNVLNRQNPSSVTQRAFLVGTPVAGEPTPLIFQDAATIAAEGLNARPFGAPTAASTSLRRERQVELGLRLEF